MATPVCSLPPVRLAALDDEPGRLFALERYAIVDTAPEQQFDKIVGLVRDVLDVPIATVSLIDRDRQWLKAYDGLSGGECDRRDAFCDYTIRARDVMLVEDAASDPRFANNIHVIGDPWIRSYAGAPLMTPDGYNLGALCAIDRVPRKFSQSQLRLLQRFAALVVEEVELRDTASRDFLTGALTRRALVEQMTKATMRQSADRSAIALVTFDLDHFKTINDNHGHPVGDLVLKSVVTESQSLLRHGHTLGRLGGEEFAILMPGARADDAYACADRLRVAISRLNVPGCSAITASFGIAALGDGFSVDRWLAVADGALYAAKHNGRNCCVLADGPEHEAAAA